MSMSWNEKQYSVGSEVTTVLPGFFVCLFVCCCLGFFKLVTSNFRAT